MSLYHTLIKPWMFRQDAEDAHRMTMKLFRMASSLPGAKPIFHHQFCFDDPRLEKEVMGMLFKNPVGLAAGFDKDGKYVDLLPLLGFGFAEIGTVTPRPQEGNPRPRLFRLPKDEALINRMGFNNEGVMAMARRLDKSKKSAFRIGGNIGKNKDTPNNEAHRDYITCFKELHTLVDFFVINVSSPNTPGLRELQNKDSLKRIVGSVQDLNVDQMPVLLKIAPDISLSQLDDIVEVVQESGLNGINCHNTTIRRDSLDTPTTSVEAIGAGGLSGKPLYRMFDLTKEVRARLSENKVVIASGGVHFHEAATRKLRDGADLVEVYTGLIYQGPRFVKKILRHILATGG